MGQYYNGEKIGTCETMYYMRMSQAEKLGDARDDDGVRFSEYLKDGETKWRFPWPDEDGREDAGLLYSNVTEFERGKRLAWPRALEMNHAARVCHAGKGYNLFIPCIQSEEFKKLDGVSLSHGEHAPAIVVKYDAMRDGERAIIFECAHCGQLQRTDAETWGKVWQHNRDMLHKPIKTSLHEREPDLYTAELQTYARELETLYRMRTEWKRGDIVPEVAEVLKEIDNLK